MPNLSTANRLMRENQLDAATELYKYLIINDPASAKMARINLSIIEQRKSKQNQNKIKIADQQTKKNKTSLEDIYNEITSKVNINDYALETKEYPLISIIVTAHNTEEYLEACIESLIAQSYPNKEIIIIDDTSSDLTPAIATRLAKTYKDVIYKRLNSNLGTYYAKNFGIKDAKGEIIFFQDSDDISHPWRISILASELLRNNRDVVRGSYSRIDAEKDEIIEVNGLIKKLGLITLGVRKTVFQKIGYFNCTTKASDDEFFHRVQKFLGKERIINNELPLYFNTYRENSLFSDMVSRLDDGSIQQKPSESRSHYVKNFQSIHATSDIESIKKIFWFPRIRDAISVKPDMTKLSNPKDPVIVNVCSIPAREHSLNRTLLSIIEQCDSINIYLDGYKKIPSYIENFKDKCTVITSSERPGLRDNGKFLKLDELTKSNKLAYYLTIDDDIIYPPDYVNAIVKKIEKYNRQCAVGVHGVILKNKPKGYFTDKRIVYNFTKPLESDKSVNLLGTGTLGFHTTAINKFSIAEFLHPGMADIYFAAHCKMHKIPMIALARHQDWLIDLNPTPEITLYHEFKGNDSAQAKLVAQYAPWGIESMLDVNQAATAREPIIGASLIGTQIALRSLTR